MGQRRPTKRQQPCFWGLANTYSWGAGKVKEKREKVKEYEDDWDSVGQGRRQLLINTDSKFHEPHIVHRKQVLLLLYWVN